MNMPLENTYNIFDIPFAAMSQFDIRATIGGLARLPRSSSIIFANAHVVVESKHFPDLKGVLNRATLVVPDGMPVAWMLQAKGQRQAQRYSGPDLMEDLFRDLPQAKHFFLGSTSETLEKIRSRFKGNAVGFYSPPFCSDGFSEEEKQKQLIMIEQSDADFIWVGLGAPKQERYVVEMASKSKRGVYLAVGAAFDFYAGMKPRAPKTLQKMGLEWAFRMFSEPRRLTKRYVSTNPQFIKLAIQELLDVNNSNVTKQ